MLNETLEPALESFLAVLLESSGARRATLWALVEDRAEWSAVVALTKGAEDTPGPLPAEGHPFSWALREDLVLQVTARELIKSGADGEWSLVAPVRDLQAVLCLTFAGSPGVNARAALDPAVRHLAALAAAAAEERHQ